MKIISRKEALELGLSKYFTGKPCKNGHICERYTNVTETKGKCIECTLARNKKWRQNNQEKKRKSNKKWQENNKEKWMESQRKGQQKYRESIAGQLRGLCDHTAARFEIGKTTKSKFKMLGYTPDKFCAHLLSGTPFKTLEEAKEAGHTIDHIVPVKYIADNIADEILAFRVAMDLDNLRLITREENASKKDRIDLPIVQETIKLLWDRYGIEKESRDFAA